MKVDDYAIEYAVKRATNKAFWLSNFDEPKDKREIQKLIWKNPVMILMLTLIMILSFAIIFFVLNKKSSEYLLYEITFLISILFIILPVIICTRYSITKHYFEEKFEK